MKSEPPWSLAVEGRLSIAQTNCTHRDIPCQMLGDMDSFGVTMHFCSSEVFRDWANVASGVKCAPNERVGCFQQTQWELITSIGMYLPKEKSNNHDQPCTSSHFNAAMTSNGTYLDNSTPMQPSQMPRPLTSSPPEAASKWVGR